MKTRNSRVRLCLEELEQRWVPSTAYSTNWAGYAVSAAAGTVTAVSGSWTVPTIVPGSSSGYSSAWVGIDGYNSNSVEQLGTDSDMVNGVPQYYAWWEMYPNPSNTISSIAVHAGDTISASVSYTSSGFVLAITDGSQKFSTTQTSSSAQRSSAEWIQEAPSSITGILPLSDFGTINFSNSQATIGGTTGQIDAPAWSSQSTAINMVTSAGSLKATTSGLTDSGTPAPSSFSVTWVSSGSGTKGHGGHKQPDAVVTQPAFNTAAILGGITPFVFQSLRSSPAVSPTVAGFLSAPLNQIGLFSSIAPARVSLPAMSTTDAGGSDGPSVLLPSLPETSDPATSQTPPSVRPEKLPAPAVQPTPSREGQNQNILQTSEELNRLSLPPERTSAVLGEGETETPTAEAAQNLIFLIPLAGAYGLTRERTSERRRRPFLN
jgi:hypothetical protein